MTPPVINNTVTYLQTHARVMAFKAVGRKRRKLKEREERGTTHGRPMSWSARVENYEKQNGTRRLTSRQLRRLGKKASKNAIH